MRGGHIYGNYCTIVPIVVIDSHIGRNQTLYDCCGKGLFSQPNTRTPIYSGKLTHIWKDSTSCCDRWNTLILTPTQKNTSIQKLVLCACTYYCGRRHTLGLFSQLPCNAEEPPWLTRSRNNDERVWKEQKRCGKAQIVIVVGMKMTIRIICSNKTD